MSTGRLPLGCSRYRLTSTKPCGSVTTRSHVNVPRFGSDAGVKADGSTMLDSSQSVTTPGFGRGTAASVTDGVEAVTRILEKYAPRPNAPAQTPKRVPPPPAR